MLIPSVWRVAAAASVLFTPLVRADDDDNPPGQSTFVSPDGSLAFGLTVPDENSDLFFSLRVKTSHSWGAVGLGSNDMKGALFLMIYQNEKGDNVTFSPRLAYGNYEPYFYEDFQYEILNGTEVKDGFMMLTVHCKECRNWPSKDSSGGFVDVTSPNQDAIYALGPKEGLYSDQRDANLKFHEEFGVFTINMKSTIGSKDPPFLDNDSKSDGANLDSRKKNKWDVESSLHAALMVIAVIILLPLGVMLRRFGRWAKWHGTNQIIAFIVILSALGLGVSMSSRYQRSMHFNSPHQIIGFILIAFLLGQLTLGLLHHREFSRTQLPTRFGKIHSWLGVGVLALAIANVFFGFSFALNRRSGTILAGVLILILCGAIAFIFWQQHAARKRRRAAAYGAAQASTYHHPWRENPGPAPAEERPVSHSPPSPGYQAPPQQVGLQSVSPWKSSDTVGKDYDDEADLGGSSTQRPREFT